LLLIGQQAIGWRIVQILRQHLEGNGQKLCQLFLVQYKHQANPLLSMNNYAPLVISSNDKNKQLKFVSQRKLALTANNKPFALLNHQSPL
jgi:hypothetical protein